MKSRIQDIALILMFIGVGYFTNSFLNNTSTPNVQPVEITISGKTEYDPGDLADFSVSTDNSKVELTSDWKVIKNNKDLTFKSINNNNIIFPVGIDKANIQLMFHGSYIDPKTKKVKTSGIIIKDIKVGQFNPQPTPPDPNPIPPEPDKPINIPDGKYKIAKTVYTTAVSLVQSGKLAESATALSISYNNVAENITKGMYTTLKDVYADLKVKNNAALNKAGENISNWQAWDDIVRKEIAGLHNSGKLSTLSDHADLLKEISIGLSYVK